MSRATLAERLFTITSTSTALFQLALVLGAPWGHLTLGGQYPGALPVRGRVIAAVSLLLLLAFGWIIRQRARLEPTVETSRFRWAAWIVVAYCVVGMVANAATPSAAERALWLPVVTLMFGASLVVARSR